MAVEGIDVATPQGDAHQDISNIDSSGKKFAIVKLGGSNTSDSPYVAPYYKQQVKQARSAGVQVGHYWFNGQHTTATAAADFFVNNLYDFRSNDIVAIDSEAEPSTSTTAWGDDDVAAFINQLKSRIQPHAIFLYCNGSQLSSSSWTKTRAAGAKLWIAAPSSTKGNPPFAPFSTWGIHQYGTGTVAGANTDLDYAQDSSITGSSGGSGGSSGGGPSSNDDGLTTQKVARGGDYTGPLDGAPGTNTYTGLQTVLSGYGYAGPVDGAPGPNTYAALQRLAQLGGYTGPVDGALATNSWKGLQTVLQGFGYTGAIDGQPGTNTYKALQRFAKLGGYTGPIDGAMGTNSWKGVQTVMTGFGYQGPIDGAPGVNTYKALQRMAQNGGYTGPVDGQPGPNTYAALKTLVTY
jgi:GH25 family lysozyme M1 (1,4-beta-N-acetylmuramidase)